MTSVNSPTLTLTTVNQEVTMDVTFNALFSQLDRNLAGLGMQFHSHIEALGMDPPSSLTGSIITVFPTLNFAVTAGNGTQVIPVNVSKTVTRASLQEDAGVGDNDEIRCKIRIHAIGFPPVFTPDAFTGEQVLIG